MTKTRRIALTVSWTPFLIAVERANEAHWLGTCDGHDEAYWTAVAKREQAKAEARGEPY